MKRINLALIILLSIGLALAMFSCENPIMIGLLDDTSPRKSGGGGDSNIGQNQNPEVIIDSINTGDITNQIIAQTGRGLTPTDPITLTLGSGIRLTQPNWLDLLEGIDDAARYIALDLSAALDSESPTGGGLRNDWTFDPHPPSSDGKDKIVSIILPIAATSIVSGTSGNPSFRHFNNLRTFSGAGLQIIGDNAFRELTSLNMTALPSTITSIGNSAFRGCTGLTQMTLHGGITSIGNSAFYGSGLTQVVLEEGITSIGDSAFINNLNLAKVVLPSTLATIGSTAFNNCLALTVVVVNRAIPPTLGINVFNNTPISMEIRVPAGSVVAYQGDSDWLAAVGGDLSRIVAIP
ncbi:MAG: leucine-rich repeat domain-containing protein [Spirochaetes bacterium]|nr:leucine-rich repeat domain-containing protein [Spirochaetota bacterium]